MDLREFFIARRKHFNISTDLSNNPVNEEQRLIFEMSLYGLKAEDILISFEPEALDAFKQTQTRPVYEIIGAPIDHLETMTILSKTDTYFSDGIKRDIEDKYINATIHLEHLIGQTEKNHFKREQVDGEWIERAIFLEDDCFENSWFRDGMEQPHGWLRLDGLIYERSVFMLKNPTLFEIMRYWILITAFSKKINLVVAITGCDEILYPHGATFEESISHGLHIQGNHISILGKGSTRKIYHQYHSRFGGSAFLKELIRGKSELLKELERRNTCE